MRIVLLAQKSLYTDIVIEKCLSLQGSDVVGLFLSKTLLHGKSTLGSLKTVLRKGGVGVFCGKFLDTLFARAPHRNYPFPVFHSKNINSPDDVQEILGLKPDVIISVFLIKSLRGLCLRSPQRGL